MITLLTRSRVDDDATRRHFLTALAAAGLLTGCGTGTTPADAPPAYPARLICPTARSRSPRHRPRVLVLSDQCPLDCLLALDIAPVGIGQYYGGQGDHAGLLPPGAELLGVYDGTEPQVHVRDRVRARDHPTDQRWDLRGRVRGGPVSVNVPASSEVSPHRAASAITGATASALLCGCASRLSQGRVRTSRRRVPGGRRRQDVALGRLARPAPQDRPPPPTRSCRSSCAPPAGPRWPGR